MQISVKAQGHWVLIQAAGLLQRFSGTRSEPGARIVCGLLPADMFGVLLRYLRVFSLTCHRAHLVMLVLVLV
ncbi:hypothetical protein, partial [Pseudomonas syringae]|uniref:hypothetical protein n=1 Tax=Pseudomonas syringae TaxID=317 RepID=UPI001C1F2E07